MSYEDYIDDDAYDVEEMIEAVEKDAAAGIWVTKDNRELKISEMQTTHIKNCINFIKRNDDEMYACYIPVFEAELKRRELERIQNESQ